MAASSKPTVDGLSRNFRVKSGTSMAALHITGVVALLKTAYPDWSLAALNSTIMTTSANGDSTGGPILDEQHNNAAYVLHHGRGACKPF
jgi:subtilisin family serine protease